MRYCRAGKCSKTAKDDHYPCLRVGCGLAQGRNERICKKVRVYCQLCCVKEQPAKGPGNKGGARRKGKPRQSDARKRPECTGGKQQRGPCKVCAATRNKPPKETCNAQRNAKRNCHGCGLGQDGTHKGNDAQYTRKRWPGSACGGNAHGAKRQCVSGRRKYVWYGAKCKVSSGCGRKRPRKCSAQPRHACQERYVQAAPILFGARLVVRLGLV